MTANQILRIIALLPIHCLFYHVTLAQSLPDLLVLKNNDSISCTIIEYDHEWTTVLPEAQGRSAIKNYNSSRVYALIKDYGLEGEKVVFGELYERQKLTSIQLVDSENGKSLREISYRELQGSAQYLNEAGTCSIIASTVLILGTGLGYVLAAQGSSPAGLLVFGVSSGISVGFGLASGINLKKAGRSLQHHSRQFETK